MSGLFGIVSKEECNQDLFFGTDYHSHMGSFRGGLVTLRSDGGFDDSIHDISTGQFKSKFFRDYKQMKGRSGIGVISAADSQPLVQQARFDSGITTFAIATLGRILNLEELADESLNSKGFLSNVKSNNGLNTAEVVTAIISQESNLPEGIQNLYNKIQGSCSLLILTKEGIYAARDKRGRTTLKVARKDGDWAVASESCAFPNLGYWPEKEIDPGEVVLIDRTGPTTVVPGDHKGMQICSFLWVYTGDPSSSYEGINVEEVRMRCCSQLAEGDLELAIDLVSGVPDSGQTHGIGYSNKRNELEWQILRDLVQSDPDKAAEYLKSRNPVKFGQAVTKYRAGYGRSYIPPNQADRDQIAKMKLIPIGSMMAEGWNEMTREGLRGKNIVLTEDSIVRNTQLRNLVQKLWDYGVGEIHVRVACPPLTSPCRYLHATKKAEELAARRAIKRLEGRDIPDISEYTDPTTPKYARMVDIIRRDLNVSTLRYLTRDNVVEAIGFPKENLCLDCWR